MKEILVFSADFCQFSDCRAPDGEELFCYEMLVRVDELWENNPSVFSSPSKEEFEIFIEGDPSDPVNLDYPERFKSFRVIAGTCEGFYMDEEYHPCESDYADYDEDGEDDGEAKEAFYCRKPTACLEVEYTDEVNGLDEDELAETREDLARNIGVKFICDGHEFISYLFDDDYVVHPAEEGDLKKLQEIAG